MGVHHRVSFRGSVAAGGRRSRSSVDHRHQTVEHPSDALALRDDLLARLGIQTVDVGRYGGLGFNFGGGSVRDHQEAPEVPVGSAFASFGDVADH